MGDDFEQAALDHANRIATERRASIAATSHRDQEISLQLVQFVDLMRKYNVPPRRAVQCESTFTEVPARMLRRAQHIYTYAYSMTPELWMVETHSEDGYVTGVGVTDGGEFCKVDFNRWLQKSGTSQSAGGLFDSWIVKNIVTFDGDRAWFERLESDGKLDMVEYVSVSNRPFLLKPLPELAAELIAKSRPS